ncbi:MAG: helix-turn-helix domain-containing protein [Oscillospiraceae bacterium]|jgi:transcriptional regulator with XRE-family HTH domain|nr:helix-turn-helix domain-containing protein [Oscillospiraceae bacterium]
MEIGKIIKSLRRERDFTQEELAETIGVTAQAISKWESGAGLPDISQVVPLSRALDVPTDVLFGTNADEDEKRIADAYAAIDKLCAGKPNGRADVYEEVVALLRELARELPNNSEAQFFLAQWLISGSDEDKYREAVKLLERVLDRATNTHVRSEAASMLVLTYSTVGEYDKANELAGTMSSLKETRESALDRVAFTQILKVLGVDQLNGGEVDANPLKLSKEDAEKLLSPIREHMRELSLELYFALFRYTEFKRRLGLADKNEYIELLKYGLPVMELGVLENESLVNLKRHNSSFQIARGYMIFGDTENALTGIETAAAYAEKIDYSKIDWDARKLFVEAFEEADWTKPLRGDPRYKAAIERIRVS